jgi:hypothetical protein
VNSAKFFELLIGRLTGKKWCEEDC